MLVQQQPFFFCYLEVSILPSRDAAVTYKEELDRLNAPYSEKINKIYQFLDTPMIQTPRFFKSSMYMALLLTGSRL
jgi:hypothetical protein